MAGRKIKDETEAIEALDAIARTELDLADWCRARGVDARSLAGWRQVLEARGYTPPEEVRFVELVRTPTPGGSPYRVHCDAFRVDVDPDFDADTLGRLLQVVASC